MSGCVHVCIHAYACFGIQESIWWEETVIQTPHYIKFYIWLSSIKSSQSILKAITSHCLKWQYTMMWDSQSYTSLINYICTTTHGSAFRNGNHWGHSLKLSWNWEQPNPINNSIRPSFFFHFSES